MYRVPGDQEHRGVVLQGVADVADDVSADAIQRSIRILVAGEPAAAV